MPSSFLILKEEGIGNALLATPMLTALRRKFPDSQIDVMASERNIEILRGLDTIDTLLLPNEIPPCSYDYGIQTEFSSGAFRKTADCLCREVITFQNRDFLKWHEAVHNLMMVRNNFMAWRGEFIPLDIHISEQDQAVANDMAGHFEYLVIHQGCFADDGVWRNRLWPVENWYQLLKKLRKKYELKILVLGGPSERKKTDELIKLKLPIIDLVGRTSIKRSAAIVKGAKLCISIDCGLMHIAAAVNTPQIALFGCTSAVKSAPWRSDNKYIIVRYPIECEACYLKNLLLFRTCRDPRCMKNISYERVFKIIEGTGWLTS